MGFPVTYANSHVLGRLIIFGTGILFYSMSAWGSNAVTSIQR